MVLFHSPLQSSSYALAGMCFKDTSVACHPPRRGSMFRWHSHAFAWLFCPTKGLSVCPLEFFGFFYFFILSTIHTPANAPSVLNNTSFTSAIPLPVKYWRTSQHTESMKAAMTTSLLFGFHLWLVQPNGTYRIRFSRLPAHTPAFGHSFRCSRIFSLYPGARRSNVIYRIKNTL